MYTLADLEIFPGGGCWNFFVLPLLGVQILSFANPKPGIKEIHRKWMRTARCKMMQGLQNPKK